MANGSVADFERMAREYWGAWGEAMRAAPGSAGPSALPDWRDAVIWWTQQATAPSTGARDPFGPVLAQAGDWYRRMQDVAAAFVGRDHAAADVARAWKQAFDAAAGGGNPFAEMFRHTQSPALPDIGPWLRAALPWLEAAREEGTSWLRLPAIGFTREHQERLQALALAQIEYQDSNNAYNAQMAQALQDAFVVFEARLAALDAEGRKIESARALFDLWIDAAEEAYAKVVLSPEFRKVYGRLVDAQMRLRAGIQREVELACAQWGMPTRTEVDATHRRIVELERALRRLRDAAGGGGTAASAAPRSSPAAESKHVVSKRTASVKGAGKRVAAKTRGATRAVTGKPTAGKAATARAVGESKAATKTSSGPDPVKAASPGAARAAVAASAARKPVRRTGPVAAAKPATRSRRKPAATAVARRTVSKRASSPTVAARRSPANPFAGMIPVPVAPKPMDGATKPRKPAKGGR